MASETRIIFTDPPKMTLAELNRCDRPAFGEALGGIFENSPWVADHTFGHRPFRDVEQLHAEMCAAVRHAGREPCLALIRAHPDLAGRLALVGEVSPESAREQAAAGLNRLGASELAEFQRLTAAYRARFGFPFILCARLNDRAAILRALHARSQNTPADEEANALSEIDKIAWLRLQDAITPDSLTSNARPTHNPRPRSDARPPRSRS